MREIFGIGMTKTDKVINDIKSHKYYLFVFKFRLVFSLRKISHPILRCQCDVV